MALPSIQELYEGAPTPNRAALIASGEETAQLLAGLVSNGGSVTASIRPDLAGSPTNLLRIPITYQQKSIRMWEAYTTDPLFMRLINRMIDFTAHSSSWDTVQDPQNAEPSWLKRVTNFFSGREAKLDRESDIWNAWAQSINQDAPNTTQGLQAVVRWVAKHLLLEGMAPMAWQWSPFKYGKQMFLFPMEMTCYPSAAITLDRKSDRFMNESMFLMMPNAGQPMHESYIAEASPIGRSSAMIELPLIGGADVRAGSTEAYALKYNWSPGDLTTTRIGQMIMTGWGQYPTPPFISLLPQFALRQKLFSADLAIADGVANYMKIFKVGNKDNPIRAAVRNANGDVVTKGDMEVIRSIIEPQLGLSGGALAMFLPWYVDLEIKMPDTAMLMSEEKYSASAMEMLQAFGIFTPRTPSGRNERFERLNLAGFEEMLGSLQWHIWTFLMRLARRVLEVNASLKYLPTWRPAPPNTKSDEFKSFALDLFKTGRMSSGTVQEIFGLDPEIENRRIAEDQARETDKLHDANVPVIYKQSSEMPENAPTPAPAKTSNEVGRTEQPNP